VARLPAIALLLGLAAAAQAEVTAADLEQAAETARRAAAALAGGQPAPFFEALDTDGILSRSREIGVARWLELTDMQRERLRSLLRERFLRELWPSNAEERGQMAWITARPESRDGVAVWIGLDYPGNRQLKTTWHMTRTRSDWRIADVVLSDPGVSLSRTYLRSLTETPLIPSDRRRAARETAMPRLALLGAILLVVVLFWRRTRENRHILILTALAPAFIVALEGTLAVRAAMMERWTLRETIPSEPWRAPAGASLDALAAGDLEGARQKAKVAVSLGADIGPLAYAIGRAENAAGDPATAETEFQRALEASPPAPGAARELAAIELAQGRGEAARERLTQYLATAGPDPEALTLLAVAALSARNNPQALEAIDSARQIVGGGLRGAELEARIRARAGDAAGTVAALQPLDAAGRLDRSLLRKDPAYVAIATDPVWERFLAEKPKPR
jgi:tetratricopeptide (TPR) repeat protein